MAAEDPARDAAEDAAGGGAGLECPAEPSATGAYRLAWTEVDARAERWTLREDGAVLYQGPDRATTVTGRPEGAYTYALTAELADPHAGGEQTALGSCTVVVDPPSLSSAFSLFGAGLLVFVATMVVVLRGHRAHRRGEIG